MLHELRQCTDDDREWAYTLKSEAYREVVERQFGPWDEQFQRALFVSRCWRPNIAKIILVDGEAVGLVAMEERSDSLWLDEIQLIREWRGRGLGSSIIRDLMQRASLTGVPLRLQVLKMNLRAQALYYRLGFSAIAETATHFMMEHCPIREKA